MPDPKTTDPTLDPRGDHDSLRLRTPAELSAGLRALRDHLRGLDSASPEAALMNEAALYLDGATASLREHMAEVGRLRSVIRVNALRWNPGLTHEQIDEVIHGR